VYVRDAMTSLIIDPKLQQRQLRPIYSAECNYGLHSAEVERHRYYMAVMNCHSDIAWPLKAQHPSLHCQAGKQWQGHTWLCPVVRQASSAPTYLLGLCPTNYTTCRIGWRPSVSHSPLNWRPRRQKIYSRRGSLLTSPISFVNWSLRFIRPLPRQAVPCMAASNSPCRHQPTHNRQCDSPRSCPLYC